MTNTNNTNEINYKTSREDAEKWLTPEGEATLRACEEELSRIRISGLLAGE
jgi:hypothetical protein